MSLEQANSILRRIYARLTTNAKTFSPSGHTTSPGGVTPDAITWGYRLFLDRMPENSRVIEDKIERLNTIPLLRREFLQSEEFRSKNEGFHVSVLSGNEPPLRIDDVEDENELQRLLQHIQTTWQYLGETEPHWSVITSDLFRQDKLAEHEDAFYASGQYNLNHMLNTLQRVGVDISTARTCLEYGCGVGRVTRWLATRFDEVIGCDISLAHLQSAQHYLTRQNVSNVTWRHIRSVQDIQTLPKVDFIYSLIVLQHNPPPIIALIVENFIRALNPGGVCFFQVPTYRLNYDFNLQKYLNTDATRHEMEMHVLPQRRIFEIVQREGGIVCEVFEDEWAGVRYKEVSNTFVVQKS